MIDLNNLTRPCDNDLFPCGDGVCVAGQCVCNEFWSTNADFVVFESDCATSIIAMYVLWGINFLFLLWAYYKSANMIILRFEAFLETRKSRKGYTLWNNKGLIAIISYFGISTPFHFIMCILQFINPETRIGFDILPTLCFFFGKLGLYICIFFVQGTMLAATLKGDPRQKNIIKGNYIFQFVVSTLSALIGTFGFITLVNYQDDILQQTIIMRAYYLIQSFVLFCNGMGAVVIKMKVNRALEKVKDLVESNGRSEGIRQKVNELQGEALKQGLLQSFIYLLMGAIPFFTNKHKYFLPISWIAMPILGKKVAHQFSADKAAKSIMQRLGIGKTGSSSAQRGPDEGITSAGGNTNTNLLSSPTAGGPMSSMMISQNPVYATEDKGLRGYRKKKKVHEQQESSFFSSEGAFLEDLLDPSNPFHARFVAFVKARYAENEVALLDATLRYKDARDSKERAKFGKKIIAEYIQDGAPREVDLPHEMKDIVLSTGRRGQWTLQTFDEIRRSLTFDLKGNFLAGFERQLDKEQEQAEGDKSRKSKGRSGKSKGFMS